MFSPVATKNPAAVQAEAQSAYRTVFPDADPEFVPRAFVWVVNCFSGKCKDYQPIDARYHDLEHTMQGTLCMMRLLRGRHLAGAHPPLTKRLFQLGLLAILLHDTGYLKKRDDTRGTGAKYTTTHVTRSAEFAREFLSERGVNGTDIKSVQNMIQCTGVDAVLSAIPFQDELEKIVGHALGTADLLGQMAADDYIDKLPILYTEFAEAAAFAGSDANYIATFSSVQDLMQKTPAFWEKYVRPKLDRDFSGVFRFLNHPYPDGPNDYMQRIEANIARLRQVLSAKAA